MGSWFCGSTVSEVKVYLTVMAGTIRTRSAGLPTPSPGTFGLSRSKVTAAPRK
jgi:hypothetical protein